MQGVLAIMTALVLAELFGERSGSPSTSSGTAIARH
jgi:hypothetical protein